MPAIDIPRLCEAANSDPEFRLAARLWDGTLRIDVGADVHLLNLSAGRATPGEAGAAFSYDVRVAGPAEGWREMLAPVPRAFYHDLSAAAARHGFALEGDSDAYYPALRRLVELLRAQQPG